MYALHEAGTVVSALPPPNLPQGPTDRLERRAVEATEQAGLATEDRPNVMYSPTTAVLQLVEGSTQHYAEMLELVESRAAAAASTGSYPPDAVGSELDIYA